MSEEKIDWSKIAEKKIFSYELKYKNDYKDDDSKMFPYIDLLMEEIQENLHLYNFKHEKENKYYAIESIEKSGQFYKIILKNCKYNFTPDIINVDTQQERSSFKSLNEGDKERTHVLIIGHTMLYESRRNGTAPYIFKTFLNHALKQVQKNIDVKICCILFAQTLDKNFLEVLKKSRKIKSTKFVVKSNLIGSEYFNFNNDNGVQDNYIIEVKAKKRNQFNKENFIQKIESLLAESKSVEKITVDICDEDNNPRIINTEEFAKFYRIYVDKTNTGEIVSDDMFNKMKGIIE